MNAGRTQNSITNIYVAFIAQLIGIIISFIARIFFIKFLGKAYLGVNGLFSNILTVLSMADLGIGTAITYSLYKPLADRNQYKTQALIELYRRAYQIIGCIVAVLGLLITPFLEYIIRDIPDIPHIYLIYLLFVANATISYFYSYKRSLIIADQYRYIATYYRYGFYLILNILQIIILVLTRNYIFFLVLQMMCTLGENIAISRKAEKMYPFLKKRSSKKVDDHTRRQIIRNTSAMIFHKLGGIVVDSTDNILISSMIGIVWVGLYSNYYMIINALNIVISQIFSSITASIGHLGATESKEKAYEIFLCTEFVTSWVFCFSSISLFILIDPFISLAFGSDFLMSQGIVLILTANFYIKGMRSAVLTFQAAYGLYWNDRFKALFEVIINLVISIVLGATIGIAGIFIGTLISMVTTCLWIEPYVIYKRIFDRRVGEYFIKLLVHTVITLSAGFITYWACAYVLYTGVMELIAKGVICLTIPNIIVWAVFNKTKEFYFIRNLLLSIIRSIKTKFKGYMRTCVCDTQSTGRKTV